MKLWNYIKEKMMEHPDQSICEGDTHLTYEELCIYAEEHGHTLSAECYGILCRSEMAAAMELLACLAGGKTAIPLPSRYGSSFFDKIIKRSQVSHLLTDYEGTLTECQISDHSFFASDDQVPAVILFTSGSTGEPKGVMLSEENLLSNVRGISSYFPINDSDTILISRPLYHSSVLTGEFLLALCNGAKIVFSSDPFQPKNILQLIEKFDVTVLGNTPTLMTVLSRFVRKQTTVRLLSISGECMSDGMAKTIRQAFPNAAIYCGYGLSEASPRVAYLPANKFDQTPTSAGIPLPNVNVYILGKDGLTCEPGKEGELLVRASSVMRGYLNDTKRTNDVIKNGFLYTGDIAYYGEDGLLYIKGRKDEMINRAGMNIYPAEIENALLSDPNVFDVLVYGYQDGNTQEIGMKISGDFLEVEEVVELCRKKLPAFQMPSKIELVFETEVYTLGKKNRSRYK